MTLRLKLFVLIAAVIIFAMSGVTAVALWREVQRGQELLRREGGALAATAAAEASRWVRADGLEPGGAEALRPVLEGLTRGGQFDRAWLVDRAGKVLACRSLVAEPCPEGPPPSEFAAVDLPLAALARLVKPEGILATAPVVREGLVVGAVTVQFTHEEVVANARALAWGASIVAAFWIVVGHVLTAIFIRQVTRPLVRLSEAAESLAEERGVRLDPPEDKELADLVGAFNHMSARLEERRTENQRLIAELEARVAQKTSEVLRADRLATLGGIAAGFAHEIGNSLNVIRGYSSVASRELPADSPVKDDVEAIRREVGRAASLIERFLVFARARTVHPHAQPIAPIVREAAEVVGPAAKVANVERVVELEDGLPDVVADAELLRQAFLNLCVNAIHAMQEQGGGRLTVRARRDGDAVVVEVADSGPGMDGETRGHVFEPFFTTKANGTGLGLAIVRQAAEAHGGSVEVESAPGAGATFRVRLPRRARRRRRPDRGRQRVSEKPNLMVVDDLDSARQMVKRVLGRSYAVFDFASVAEAVPALDRARFDAIVTDLRMPGVDGIEGLRRFKAKVPEIPVILVTAFATVETAVEAMKAGAFDYLKKPFEPEELEIVVARAVEHGRIRRENAELRSALSGEFSVHGIVGKSQGMKDLVSMLERIAPVGRPHPHRGRVRHRQGPARPRRPRAVLARLGAVRRAQHERHPGEPRRVRAVRPREGRVHRRRPGALRASSPRRRAGRSSSTRSGCSRPRSSRSCSGSCRTASTSRSAAASRARRTCASSPRRTRICRRASRRGGSARTSGSGSASSPSGCRRCASAGRTSRSSSSTS